MIIASQRHLFEIPETVAYFNNAYMSPLMHSVLGAMRFGLGLKAKPWTISSDDFFTYAEQTRSIAAQIFGSAPDNIAIVPSASYGIQTAANALPLKAGQTVLVLEDQFPSNIYPWQEKAKRCGAAVKILPTPSDDDWTAVLLAAIDETTAIAALPQTHWSTGATLDLAAIRHALDAVGAALVLDITQSLGAQVFDMETIRPDFAVAATYKWMMGPYSMGFLYVDPKWHEAEPLEHSWINRLGAEDFTRLTDYQSEFSKGARRFDMGEKSNASQLMGAGAAMTQILDWGVENIQESLFVKTTRLSKRLEPFGLRSSPRRAPHYLGLKREGGIPENLTADLAAQNIFVSVRGPAMRITPHLYCNDHDEDRLVNALEAAL